jgi:hypothetical protein
LKNSLGKELSLTSKKEKITKLKALAVNLGETVFKSGEHGIPPNHDMSQQVDNIKVLNDKLVKSSL